MAQNIKRAVGHDADNIRAYGAHSIDVSDIRAVTHTLRHGWLTQGPQIEAFETSLATYCGARYAIAVSSGTAALHCAYLAAGIGPGDEVITTPNTFVATSNMLLAVGAKPVFCDIRSDTKNIDEEQVESRITKKTKAIVPVHFAGSPAAMDVLIRIARKHKLLVIEDACHALGAEFKGRKIGSLPTAMAIFSFHPVKNITTGEGGAIVTNSKRYWEMLRQLRSHGIEKDAAGYNSMVQFGYNYRMTDIQASLGISQLKKIDNFMKKRKMLVQQYLKELGGVSEVIPLGYESGVSSAWHIFVITVASRRTRSALIEHLRTQGIGTNIHYPAVYSHPYYRENGFAAVQCVRADMFADTCITLPLHPRMTRRNVKYITNVIKNFFTHDTK